MIYSAQMSRKMWYLQNLAGYLYTKEPIIWTMCLLCYSEQQSDAYTEKQGLVNTYCAIMHIAYL